ncbi:efflux RND transporter permease subunit [Alteromonas macleodii]|uniref:AcrB/AcrD/AcrF family protein n=1 Tax=Alteromonas macleodii TaxID=28108 RepID=A0AB36FQT2_ALTMA|nr:efflux RND transporter permease subunit [Alteromonas macleodii]OES28311.1 acrB/AcrD/AcrF family protein [Alteromonas macleodii]OES28395.1 acrB/AcrD/AcrF family protein [Alteromonas macleodii]OES28423.1 acrB/AcrD/AcrF family protein [Alteromonas macleodii]OES39975.1 acrB/AcrD/AcrF family protein [Alteromonas macleodii]
MLALVRVALNKPYTFVVLALLIVILGAITAAKTPKDIFPNVDIPIIAIAWQYRGLPPDEMAGRITTPFQRALTSTVNNIEHLEATSYNGFGVVKVYFHPTVDINMANAQVTAVAQTMVRQMPSGTQPPLIMNYSASTVPVLQLALSGKGLTEQQLADLAMNQLRSRLVTVQGTAIPWPFGGKSRQIQIDLDPDALQARGLSGQDVANALAEQNVIIPAGTQKIGEYEYTIQINNAPKTIEEIGDLPIRVVDGTIIYIRDVADVYDGSAVQTNIVHVDGGRSVLMSIFKNGNTSTLDVIEGIKRRLEEVKPSMPDTLEVKRIGDQSLFVKNAVNAVLLEGIIAALLTSLMILLFLGSWRSTLIVTVSIPLSILGALTVMSALGHTLNIMTLGGLALAVGILVDEATVTIESINAHLEEGKDVVSAIIDGAQQIATPAFVSLLCICIVFVPMYFLQGIPKYLFVPMAEAVMLSMLFSFLLSRTLIPTLAKYLLVENNNHSVRTPTGMALWLSKGHKRFEQGFKSFQHSYSQVLTKAIASRKLFLAGFLSFAIVSFALMPFIGRNFFPTVDSGQISIHARAPVGLRVEETAARFGDIQKVIREVIPERELAAMVDNVGTYISSMNTIYANNGMIGSQDGDIQISLAQDHAPTDVYIKRLREVLPERFPDMTFSFLPADMVSQVLNFGAPSPIDIQIRGNDLDANFDYANTLIKALRAIPGIADVRVQQSRQSPSLDIEVDRTQAAYGGLTQRDISQSLVVNLSGSAQVAPTFWLNPENGVSYPIVMQTPQRALDSLSALENLQLSQPSSNASDIPITLSTVASLSRSNISGVVSEYNIRPMVQIFATTQGRDLGAVSEDIRSVIDSLAESKPKGATVELEGQVATMNQAYNGLLWGLLGAVGLIYFVIVINFQSWRDPFVIICALPFAIAGILWMLFATKTTFSVPALTGAIMCMGVATANSVLVISFAREKIRELGCAREAAIAAGFARLRPVLMTASAMIIGMLPMAIGLGEGGEQNAPLGRAVIGGLLVATLATLFFVPVLFSLLHKNYVQPSTGDANV